MKKKEVIKSLMNRYGRKFIAVNEDLKSQFIGTASNIELKEDIIYSLEFNDTLGIKDTITKDNIHIYYEFMSDQDKIKISHTVLNEIFREREKQINDILNTLYLSELSDMDFVDTVYFKTNDTENPDIYNDGKCLFWGKNTGTIGVSYFNIFDNLNPIEEYIIEIKNSDRYKKYISKVA